MGKDLHNFNTEQENFWAGDFGSEYTDRNRGYDFLQVIYRSSQEFFRPSTNPLIHLLNLVTT